METLPKLKIAQSDVDASAECPVCKDFFAVDEEAHELPCKHLFHPDCILPWLKQVGERERTSCFIQAFLTSLCLLHQHNSCPVCRHELPTDDPDYESRRTTETARAHNE